MLLRFGGRGGREGGGGRDKSSLIKCVVMQYVIVKQSYLNSDITLDFMYYNDAFRMFSGGWGGGGESLIPLHVNAPLHYIPLSYYTQHNYLNKYLTRASMAIDIFRVYFILASACA